MKTVEYWEKKQDEVRRALELFDRRITLKGNQPPPRKDGMSHETWRVRYTAWLHAERVTRLFSKQRAKLVRRLAFIDDRIRATIPTFWTRL